MKIIRKGTTLGLIFLEEKTYVRLSIRIQGAVVDSKM